MIAVLDLRVAWSFYNSFLPVIATEDKYDKTSALGFAYGYIGSVLLLYY